MKNTNLTSLDQFIDKQMGPEVLKEEKNLSPVMKPLNCEH